VLLGNWHHVSCSRNSLEFQHVRLPHAMSENLEKSEASAETTSPDMSGAAAGIAVALNAAQSSAPLDERVAEFLVKQTRLADLQAEHLHEQRWLQLSHLRWRRFEDRMRAAIKIMTVLAFGGFVATLGAILWSAAHEHGLVVEAFSVPPDVAARGLSGQVFATQIEDRLSYMLFTESM
jgi:hypothetical protein